MIRHLETYKGVFDAAAIQILVAAFDEAWKSVEDSGRVDATDATREILAKHIVDAAGRGQRDHRSLCDGALQHLAAEQARA